MTAIIDALDALAQRPVDLGKRGEAMAPVAEAHVAHQDFDQSLDDGFILWLSSRAPGPPPWSNPQASSA